MTGELHAFGLEEVERESFDHFDQWTIVTGQSDALKSVSNSSISSLNVELSDGKEFLICGCNTMLILYLFMQCEMFRE